MKKITALFLTTLFVLCGVMTQAAQAQHYGALRSFLSSKQVSLGVGGGQEHLTWINEDDLYRQKVVYGKVGLGLGKAWQATGLIGAVDLDAVPEERYSSGAVPFIGGSIGGPIFSGRTLSVGPVVQANYTLQAFDSSGKEIEKMLKISAALLAQIEMDGASLYLGPSINTGDATFAGTSVEKGRSLGGVVGIRWLLPANWPTDSNKMYLDLELGNKDFDLNKVDVTFEINVAI